MDGSDTGTEGKVPTDPRPGSGIFYGWVMVGVCFATQFMITEYGGAGIDSPIENVTQPIDIIPEPSTALLLSVGLAFLGGIARHRRV